jgi:hypothetical protein
MEQAQPEQQVPTQEQQREGHFVIAGFTAKDQTLQRTVTEKLSGNNNTYTLIPDTATPQQIVNRTAEEETSALVCLLNTVGDRRLVYRIMTVCRKQKYYIPVLLLGEAADPQYAQILALPEHGDLYQGGVYYCEDVDEMMQVLKYIILYVPPPVQHDHDTEVDFLCSDCGSCADNCGFNQEW